jgi:glutathione peroxidase
LRTLHEDNKDKGCAVLAFPCNQFGAQEPGSNEEIEEFASSKYDVTFPMFAKTEVNGDGACDLYNYLKSAQPLEVGASEGPADISWNFAKFLVDGKGNAVARFSPKTTPEEIAQQLGNWL